MKRLKKMNLKGFYPICFIDKDVILSYKEGYLYVLNIRTLEILKKNKVIKTFKERILSKVNLASRFFRLGVRVGTYIGNDTAIIVIGKTFYEVDLKTLQISSGYQSLYRPLKFTTVHNIANFDNGVYYGDYMVNTERKPASIYKRSAKDLWEIVYTFKMGEINHIHNIVPDIYRNCLWIFTGDFDDSVAIWCAKNNFKSVVPIFRGSQIYRGCVGFVTEKHMIYMTDTPFEDNYICRISYDNFEDKWIHEKISPINGSCIYGTKLNDNHYVFQTTVEPDGRNTKNLLKKAIERKRGAGIKDDYVYLYSGTPNDGFNIIYKQKKDFWPFALFQFGTFQFPDGINEGNLLPFYSIAVKKYNNVTQIIKL